jgi:hypothetical protein
VRIIAACILALTLAGCSDVPGDPGFAHHPLDCSMGFSHADCEPGTAGYNNSPQAIAASDDAQCRSYGAAPGSPAYIQCRMNIDNQRGQMRAAIASQLIGRMSPPPTQNMNVNVTNCNANPALCVGR